jgi:PAS domain S-box-containing protein
MTNSQPLLAAEQSLRDTFERVPVGMAQLDRHGRFLAVNRSLCALLGYEREELLRVRLHHLTTDSELQHDEPFPQQLNNVSESTIDRRLVRADGSLIWLRLTLVPVHADDENGDVVLMTAHDISAQVAAEEARVVAEQRLATALRASRVGTFQFNVRTSTLEWDSELQRLFGHRVQPLTTLDDFMSAIHPGDRARVASAYARCIDEGAALDEEFRVIWEDGSIHWLHDRGEVLNDAQGRPHFITGACTDMTEARLVEEELRRRDARFRTLANNIPQLAWIAERDATRTWFNERWYEYTAQTYEQSRDVGWHDAIHPDDLDRVRVWQLAAFRAGHMWEDTVRIRRRDGEYRTFLSRAVPVMDADGIVRQWFGTDTDITERTDRVQQLQTPTDDRQPMLDAEQRARSEAQYAIRIRDEVLSVVAHDLRNPVQTIVMSASALTDLSLDDAQRGRQMEIIKRSAWRMNRLIDDLLDASQMETGRFAITRRAVDVPDIISELFDQFELLAADKGITLERQLDPQLPPISGDAGRLVQACTNLIANALKFTERGGTIRVRASATVHNLLIDVEDTGCGIAADHLERVFRRFWQADARAHGVGLGLVIARGIIEAHGGTIRVASTLGRGSTFTIVLPLDSATHGAAL